MTQLITTDFTIEEGTINLNSNDFSNSKTENIFCFPRVESIDLYISTEDSNLEEDLEEIEKAVNQLLEDSLQLKDLPSVFKGLFKDIPKKVKEPKEGECCGSGCEPCVWDVYETKKDARDRLIQEVSEKINENELLKKDLLNCC